MAGAPWPALLQGLLHADPGNGRHLPRHHRKDGVPELKDRELRVFGQPPAADHEALQPAEPDALRSVTCWVIRIDRTAALLDPARNDPRELPSVEAGVAAPAPSPVCPAPRPPRARRGRFGARVVVDRLRGRRPG